MDPGFEADFREFVVERSGALFRTAYLLTGDRHAAEDLVQSALTKTAAKWRGLRDRAAIEGYVRRVMYHEQVSRWRRGSRVAEVSTGKPVQEFERAAEAGKALGLPAYAKGKLEGFAFPATYEVSPESTPDEILAAMVTRFHRAAENADLVDGARRVGRTPLEIVTIASIVQAETLDERDMPKVARVIHNRLNHTPEMRLQVDSTVLYGLNKYGVEASHKDLRSRSPYNTYAHLGLPPGPIGNPGVDAIEAALKPARGAWLYFVTTDPKKGTTEFAASESEFAHLVKKRRTG